MSGCWRMRKERHILYIQSKGNNSCGYSGNRNVTRPFPFVLCKQVLRLNKWPRYPEWVLWRSMVIKTPALKVQICYSATRPSPRSLPYAGNACPPTRTLSQPPVINMLYLYVAHIFAHFSLIFKLL